ncbi:oxidoreductase [Parasulfuritortus cantonensis]|uniref:Oxidoreductase n=1 Tax=Parasulfuritortus cantonensis TaxID=2528202 RepID=A0A4R1B407_9PROT|nr:FAD-binding oxidoreductase [Parasulfuritortus cantonensis]TCJ12814.1 oxidoreductase [Parasulfuritortus cantonensis]
MSDTAYEADASSKHQATVLRSTRLTPEDTAEVRQIVFRVDGPAYYFPEGQSIGVLVPGPHPFGNKTHHRYYTLASVRGTDAGTELEILVRRCSYIDEVSGEEYPGIASTYLCDAKPGDSVTLTGPYRSPFMIPADKTCNLLLVGAGTGIAPFRAFLHHIYEQEKGWQGQVRLYYGARTGVDMLYMNDLNNDLANYYDQATFKAIQAIGGGYFVDEGEALRRGVRDHAREVWQLLQDPKTHVYLAGMEKVAAAFNAALGGISGAPEAWEAQRQRMIEERRWAELTYK